MTNLKLISRSPVSLRKQLQVYDILQRRKSFNTLRSASNIFIVAERTRRDQLIPVSKSKSKSTTSRQVTNLPTESFSYLVHNLSEADPGFFVGGGALLRNGAKNASIYALSGNERIEKRSDQ